MTTQAMAPRDWRFLIVGISSGCLALYFLSLVVLTVQWNLLLAVVVMLIGLVSWMVLGYWLLMRLIQGR